MVATNKNNSSLRENRKAIVLSLWAAGAIAAVGLLWVFFSALVYQKYFLWLPRKWFDLSLILVIGLILHFLVAPAVAEFKKK